MTEAAAAGRNGMANDNWGWKARIGIFIVAVEAVPEAEWWAMAPRGTSVHAARVTAGAPWARWRAEGAGIDLAEDLARGARQFAGMRLTAAVLAHSSSSILGGPGWDEAVIAGLAAEIGPGTAVTTTGLDSQAALRACGARRPFLVLPPWFDEAFAARAIAYYTDSGFAPAGHLRLDPGPRWRHLAPGELYRAGMGLEQEVQPLPVQVRAACPAAADAVLFVGTGLRCVAILDALEQELARPVLSANQASLWHCLRLSGVDARIEGFGSLFER